MKANPNNLARITSTRSGLRFALRLLTLSCLFLLPGPVSFSQTKEQIEETQRGLLTAYYFTEDPAYQNVAVKFPELQSALADLKASFDTVRANRAGEFEAEFKKCSQSIEASIRRNTEASTSSAGGAARYAATNTVLTDNPEEIGGLRKTVSCATERNQGANPDPALKSAIARVETLRREMDEEFAKIDKTLAAKKAQAKTGRTVETNPCEDINFEKAGFTVTSSRVEDPFDFLPWVRDRQKRAADQISALVDNQLFRYETATGKALDIIEKENFLPDTSDVRVKLRVELVSVENCANSKLDLVYRVYSSQVMPVLSGIPEARVTEKEEPETAAGQTTVNVPLIKPFRFKPLGGYDALKKLHGGGQFEFKAKDPGKFPIHTALIKADASRQFHDISAALAGSHDSAGWLAHSEYRLTFSHFTNPTGAGRLKGGHLSAQFAGISQPFAGGNLTFRFGGLLEGGNRQSSVGGALLPPDTVSNTGFGSLKLYAGVSGRLRRHVLAASYGLELGSIGPASRIDWRKHIGDVRHEFWYPLGNHRILDVESRFSIGRVDVSGDIPLAERFFGGNNEEFFLPNDTFQIRANPVIRAIPASSFFRTASGTGGDRFFSYNLTAAYAVWRKPLVPEELTADEDFKTELDKSIETITGNLQNFEETKDAHYQALVPLLPQVSAALNSLKTAITTAQEARPGQFETEFKQALRTTNTAIRRTDSAIQTADAVGQYGLIRALLSPSEAEGENRLAKAITAVNDLMSVLGTDAGISAALTRVGGIRNTMESEFQQIDEETARQNAVAQMAFTRRTLKTLFNDVNIYSVSPVVVFDVARLSRQRGGIGGIRYGPGLGLRLEFASIAHLTSGYAWNVRRGPGERRGTIFFAIGVRDLFQSRD